MERLCADFGVNPREINFLFKKKKDLIEVFFYIIYFSIE